MYGSCYKERADIRVVWVVASWREVCGKTRRRSGSVAGWVSFTSSSSSQQQRGTHSCFHLLSTMASQLLPLGMFLLVSSNIRSFWWSTELVDKCVGSRIWVVMKSEKGLLFTATTLLRLIVYRIQRHARRVWRLCQYVFPPKKMLSTSTNSLLDMVLEDVTE